VSALDTAVNVVAESLAARLGAQVTRDAPASAVTTYRCGGPFAILVHVERSTDLQVIAGALALAPDLPVAVVGRGSNLLVADAGFHGIALILTGEFEQLDISTTPDVHVDAGGAVALPVLARRAAVAGVAGLEFFVGIPGSVGGAVRMNAGGHGAETKDVIVHADVFDLASGAARSIGVADLGLGYRTSALRRLDVVVGARFAGHTDDPDACSARIEEIVRWRREHQPGGQNAGSVFTNPPGDSAGRLIDECGLKGFHIGGAAVSTKHANFFVAEPGAAAADVRALIEEVRRRVADATGVELRVELEFLGFDDAQGAKA
jgi:UDP-N-acetylmuramate dehydrogenase